MERDREQDQDVQITKEDVIHRMEELAYYYTPEWQFHPERPDPGTALAEAYADMYMRMLQQYRLAPERDKQLFFQWLGVHRNPSEPAKGYVTFGVQKEAGTGITVPAGTGLIGRSEDAEAVYLQTSTEIYASTSEIRCVYLCDGKTDRIRCLAEGEGPLLDESSPNLQEHVCQFGHSDVIPLTGEVELLVELAFVRRKADWDLVLMDSEVTGFSYLSVQGEWEFPDWEWKEQRIYLKKTKNMPDFLPVTVENRECACLRWHAKSIEAYAGLELNGILLGSIGSKQAPERICTADGMEGVGSCFPFGERPYSFGECYVCSNAVFGRRGAVIRLECKLEFRKIPLLTEPVSMPIQWKTIMKQSDFREEKVVPVTIGEVIWEYYNGSGFTSLFRESLYTRCFTPEGEDASEGRICMEFLCPLDIQPFFVQAGNYYCIRARISRMENAYTRNGYYLTPFITGLELAYDYRDCMQEPEICICRNHLEEKRMNRNQSFVPFQELTQKQQTYYIGFDRELRGGPFGLYCKIHPDSSDMQRRWSYEYYTGMEWKGIVVEDGTDYLRKSGVMQLFINEATFPCSLFGSKRHWIRLLAMEDSEREPEWEQVPIRELWWNTVSAAVDLKYLKDEKAEGQEVNSNNPEMGQVCQLQRPIRFLNRITNHYAFTGGRKEETEKEAMERFSRRLSHHDRAVMLSDYEALVKEASREVIKVKAFSGRRSDNKRESGAITIVVLPEAFDKEGFDFQALQQRIREYILERMPGICGLQNRLSIILPWFTEIRVSALCILKPQASLHSCRAEVEEALHHFLNPLTGNFDGTGWGIGAAPRVEQIRNALREIQGIEAVKGLVVKAYRQMDSRLQEIDLTGSIPPYVVIISGKHRIRLERYERRDSYGIAGYMEG